MTLAPDPGTILGMRIGSVIRAARKARGLSGQALARLLGVSGETVCRWEHDKIVPSWEHHALLTRHLGVPWPTPDEVLAAKDGEGVS